MAELKTKKTAVSVDAFLSKVANAQRREDAYQLVKIMKEITGEPPRMWGPSIVGFGEYHYVYDSGHEGDMCLTGFSPRAPALVVYCYAGLCPRLFAKLGKCKASKACLYIKRLADIDLAVLREMIKVGIDYVTAKYKVSPKSTTAQKKSPKKK
jgi:hypothetical protein